MTVLRKILNGFRYLIILNFGARILGHLIGTLIGEPLDDSVPLILFGGCAFLFAAYWLAPRVKESITESGWMYKLYRYRSPANAGMLARPPLSPGIFERLYLRVRPPRWCRRWQDDLMIVYREQDKLMREGGVALAVLVQANLKLFSKGGPKAAPASVLYTTDGEMEDPVLRLTEISQKLYALKNTKPEDEDERRFARIVSYEMGRKFRVSVPESLSQGLDVTYTTIMIHRKHLPFGYLTAGYFPLLIHQESRAAMILPARYWPEELIADWTPPSVRV